MRKFFLLIGIGILNVPVLGFLVIFDLTTPAYKFDEEYNGSRYVALGPRPRYSFCKPTYDIHYDGKEWPFRVFNPMCSLWRWLAGCAPPKEEEESQTRQDDSPELTLMGHTRTRLTDIGMVGRDDPIAPSGYLAAETHTLDALGLCWYEKVDWQLYGLPFNDDAIEWDATINPLSDGMQTFVPSSNIKY